MAKTAWGIEAGTSSVKAVQLTHDGKGNVTLNDFTILPLSAYRVEGADESMALTAALRTLVQDKEIMPGDTCYVSLHGRNAFSRVVTLPPVSEDKIRETIANEARGQIPIRLEDAVWDYQRISGGAVGEIEVNLYAVKREVVNQLVSACKNADLPVRGIALAPLGVYNFVKYELDMIVSDACVCVDIGADNTDLLIIDGEKTWMRIIPAAGMELTKALLSKFKKLKPEQAEQLKRKVGRPQEVATMFKMPEDQAEKLCAQAIDTMKEPLKELVGEIYRSVGFYKGQNADVLLNKLVMMGNGSKQHNIQKFFSQQLQYEVHRVDDLTSILPARTIDPSDVKKNVQSLAVAMGLALQACEVPGLNETNLIPAELIIEEKLERVRPMAVVSGGIVLLAGVIAMVLGLLRQPAVDEMQLRVDDLAKRANDNLSTKQNAIAQDQVITQDVVALNNANRGRELPMLTSMLVSDTMSKIFGQAGDARVIVCDMPDAFISNIATDNQLSGIGQKGFDVQITEAIFTNEPNEDEVSEEEAEFVEEESKHYRRETEVLATLNFATLVDFLVPPHTVKVEGRNLKDAANRYYADVAETLAREVARRLELITTPDSKYSSQRERRQAMMDEFGDQDLVDAMNRLRNLLPEKSARKMMEDGTVTLTGQFPRMGELSDYQSLFKDKSQGGVTNRRYVPTPQHYTNRLPIPVYAHFTLVVKLRSEAFKAPGDEAMEGEEGVDVQ